MKLSTKGRYGTRALLDLALRETDEPVPLKDIARRQRIQIRYLENLITPLIAHGILRSYRGNKGGVSLAKSPREIKLSEVVQALEGTICLVDCVDDPDSCERSPFCVTRDIWDKMGKEMKRILDAVTLQDLVDRQRNKEQSQRSDHYAEV
jgi:Rrf2 family transcriptional regulator, cysteine metabolism repressor